MACPTSGFPLSPPSSMSDPAQPPQLCTQLFAPTHSDYLLMESLTFWGLFQMSSLQNHVLGNSFFFSCRFEENSQSRLFISRHPPLPPSRLSSGCFFWRGLLCSCSRFRSICSARDNSTCIPIFGCFSSLLKEKQQRFMEGVSGQQTSRRALLPQNSVISLSHTVHPTWLFVHYL